jgi:hypothetical protein
MVMRIAILHWRGRISPVLDAARKVLVVETGEDGEQHRLRKTDVAARAEEFLRLGADVLPCGAISAPLEAALAAHKIQAIGFLSGPVEGVLAAFLDHELSASVFGMPDLRGRRERFRERSETMSASGAGGHGPGCGRGLHGRRGGGRRGAPAGGSVCPACGERRSHRAGEPCRQLKCPKCGGAMTRA